MKRSPTPYLRAWDRHMKKTYHGMSRSPEYKLWGNIKQRCRNHNTPYFHNYGARGVSMYGPWENSFEQFLQDVGERPGPGYSLDRIDNSRGYTPGNVRWATKRAQACNMRKNRIITCMGKSMTISEWADEVGLAPSTIHYRLSVGMSVENALFTPRRSGRKSTGVVRRAEISFIDCADAAGTLHE